MENGFGDQFEGMILNKMAFLKNQKLLIYQDHIRRER